MRKIALMMSALAVCMAASGQNAQSTFFPEGTTWVEKTTNIIESTYRYDNYLVGGNTVIGGKDYNKLLINGRATGNCLREDGGKVYMYDISYSREFLLYDFDWSVGKELVFEYADPYVEPMRIAIGEIGQMRLSDGSMCDCLGYGDGGFLLRGIGFNDGVLTHAYMQPTNGDRKVLHSFTRDGVLLYKHKDDAFDCEEAYWVSEFYPDERPMQLSMIIFQSKGDTVYDGEVWQKVYGCEVTQDDFRTLRLELDTYDYSLFGLTHKDGDKVYGVVLLDYFVDYHGGYFNDGEPFLLYDFRDEKGTEITYPGALWPYTEGDMAMEVSGTVEEEFYGITRRAYSCDLYHCVEGIGEIDYLGPFGVLFSISTGQNPHLLSCIIDGKAVFGEPDVVSSHGLKYYYDLFIAQADGASSTWTIGRVEGGKVASTYTVMRVSGFLDDKWECGASQYAGMYIDKWNSDLATITINGVTRDLYDFGLDVGDTFDNGVVHLTVTAVDTAFVEGYERRILTMDSGEQWIDGIGSTRGLLAPVTEPTDEYEEVLLSCRSGDVVMYENPVYGNGIAATASQNGAHIYAADGVLHAEMAADGDYRIGIYDMAGTEVTTVAFTGQTLSHPLTGLPHGVYAVSVSDSNGNAVGHGKVVR